MGCCLSSRANPYPNEAPSSSARAINPPIVDQPTHFSPSAQSSRLPSGSQGRHNQRTLDQHLNKPLRRYRWSSKSTSWTRRKLDKERIEFFETRVTGRPEIWQTIHAALQVLWEDPTDEGESERASANDGEDRNLATAQSILEAVEISIPTGDLVNGVYDPLGGYYPLPAWVISDPENLGTDEEEQEEEDILDKETERRREKGKEVVDTASQIMLRARLSESGQDVKILISPDETVSSIVTRLIEESGLESRKIRLAYMGKILKPHKSLEVQGWQAEHVVNAMVFPG